MTTIDSRASINGCAQREQAIINRRTMTAHPANSIDGQKIKKKTRAASTDKQQQAAASVLVGGLEKNRIQYNWIPAVWCNVYAISIGELDK